MSSSMREAQALDWLEDLREFGHEIVSVACAEWRRQPGGKRPTPGDIRTLCIAHQREARLALPAPEMTEQDARQLADKWAQGHGYSDIEAYQSMTTEGNGLWVGRRWYFAGRRKYEPPELPPAPHGFVSVGAALGAAAQERTAEQMAAGRRALGLGETP